VKHLSPLFILFFLLFAPIATTAADEPDMDRTWPLYVYEDGKFLVAALTAIQAVTPDNKDDKKILDLVYGATMLIAMLWGGLQFVKGNIQNPMMAFGWIAGVYGMFILPYAKVLVMDMDMGDSARFEDEGAVVDDIPLGFAVIVSGSSLLSSAIGQIVQN
jgi:hypothetical protein